MPSRTRAGAPLMVVLLFVVSRLLFQPLSMGTSTFSFRGDLLARSAASLSGRHLDASTLGDGMPILDRQLLLHDLPRSIWYLHSQPPLFNLLVAGMLRLPGDFARNYQWLNWIMGLALYLAVYFLMRRLNVRPAIAAIAVGLFMLNPNAMWMESAVYYGLPLALLLVMTALAWDNAMRSGSVACLAVASLLAVLQPLARAFFTPIWCALVLLFFGITFGRRHRGKLARTTAATILPFLLVVAFQVKQYVLFRQLLGSSWFGCNLAAMTATMSNDKVYALAAGKVSPLVTVYRNAPPETFLPYFHIHPTGVPALDQLVKSTGQPNFNQIVYIPVGRIYLRDTLYLIGHHPFKYLLNVVNSVYILSGYQPGVYFDLPERLFARFSWSELLAPFLGFPLLVIALWTAARRLRSRDEHWPLIAFLLFNVLYVIGVSCLFEKSEGPIYRFQVDAFLWTFLAIAVQSSLPVFARRVGDVEGLSGVPLASAGDVRH